MTIERDETELIRSWLVESYEAERDADAFLERMLGDVPTTAQRHRRWWSLAPGRHRTASSVSDPTMDHQPGPILASDGHGSSISRRTQSMFSPVKAITIGAAVFALGGALLIAQPFGPEGTDVPQAQTSAQPGSPVEFTATWASGGQVQGGEITVTDSVVHSRGRVNRPVVISEATDPRLRGTLSIATDSVAYNAVGGPVIWKSAFRIDNADGAWQQVPAISMSFPDGEEPAAMVGVFVGEGDYDGLIAVFERRATGGIGTVVWDLHGYIVEGELPPGPEPFVSE